MKSSCGAGFDLVPGGGSLYEKKRKKVEKKISTSSLVCTLNLLVKRKGNQPNWKLL
jgi:hypothetical protein